MRKFLLVPLMAVAAFGLTGCLAQPPAPPAVTVTAEPAPEPVTPEPEPEPVTPPDDSADRDRAFQSAVAERLGEDFVEPARNLATAFCADLDTYTFESLFVEYASQAEDQNHAERIGFVIGAGVPAYCPEHTAEMQEYYDKVMGGSSS